MHITPDDVDALALGCELLGSGGGGSTAAARMILTHHLTSRPPVQVLTAVAPGTYVACVGAVGAAALMLEDIPTTTPFIRVVDSIRRHGSPVNAIVPLEVGGVNGLLAVLTASALAIPLVDADPKGRAFTHIHRNVLGSAIPLTTLAFASSQGAAVYFEANDGDQTERMVRSILPSVGSWGAVACFPGRAETVVSHCVPGTISRALGLGADLALAIGGDPGPMLARPDVTEVFTGTVIEAISRPGVEVGGVASLRHHRQRSVARLDFSNEYIALFDNGELTASAPDIICVLDEHSWRPIPVDRLTPMHRVRVIRIDAAPALRAAHEATADFGLASHGLANVRRS